MAGQTFTSSSATSSTDPMVARCTVCPVAEFADAPEAITSLRQHWEDCRKEVIRLTFDLGQLRHALSRVFQKEGYYLQVLADIERVTAEVLAAEARQQTAWQFYSMTAGISRLGATARAREITG